MNHPGTDNLKPPSRHVGVTYVLGARAVKLGREGSINEVGRKFQHRSRGPREAPGGVQMGAVERQRSLFRGRSRSVP